MPELKFVEFEKKRSPPKSWYEGSSWNPERDLILHALVLSQEAAQALLVETNDKQRALSSRIWEDVFAMKQKDLSHGYARAFLNLQEVIWEKG